MFGRDKKEKEVIVKRFATAGRMEKVSGQLIEQGYELAGQSGALGTHGGVVCTFRRVAA
jgi:hypothetical protein